MFPISTELLQINTPFSSRSPDKILKDFCLQFLCKARPDMIHDKEKNFTFNIPSLFTYISLQIIHSNEKGLFQMINKGIYHQVVTILMKFKCLTQHVQEFLESFLVEIGLSV